MPLWGPDSNGTFLDTKPRGKSLADVILRFQRMPQNSSAYYQNRMLVALVTVVLVPVVAVVVALNTEFCSNEMELSP